MPRIRTIDLEQPPDREQEIRLQSGDCVVSIWLPASAGEIGRALSALSDAGFDIARIE